MIIKVGNERLLPWSYILYNDYWIRQGDNGHVKLWYETLFPRWYPEFCGSLSYLQDSFETHGVLGNHKHKHYLAAQEQVDKFLIRMGKLTLFL
jgi:hypothetical protein